MSTPATPPATDRQTNVLLELRPAVDGYAGIPQETRLLFRGLCGVANLELEGLIVPPYRRLARGTSSGWLDRFASRARRINRYSRVVVSLSEKPFATFIDAALDYLLRRTESFTLSIATLFRASRIALTRFESHLFEDFIWRTFFSKSLLASDFKLVTSKNHRICSVGWESQQRAGLFTLNFSRSPSYPKLDTRGFDVFIAQTPYPARVSRATRLVIRYHDAIPIFMPHTIDNKRKHQAHHFYSLMGNVRAGAYFACVSEASRQALLDVFPEVAGRATTIHNMLSQHYFQEESSPKRVPQIIRNRLDGRFEITTPKFFTLREAESFYRRSLNRDPLRYLLVVSKVEPRKNHARLLAAWEYIRSDLDPDLKLVVVGGLGWDYDVIMRGFKSAIDQGHAFFLSDVPAPELRVLYRHAVVTACPSLAEGFDYSGVEAMRCGGLVLASDIPVHREIYNDAAEYFDPYSTMSLVDGLRNLLAPGGASLGEHLRDRGAEVAAQYLPERIMPQWEAFLRRVTLEGKA